MLDIKGRNAEHRESLEQLANREGLSLQVLELDVTDEGSVQDAVLAALRDVGQLDVVINNAGVAGIGVTEAFTPEQFQQMFDINFFGVVRVNRAVLPSMRRRRSGLLIHVSSGAGRVTIPAMAAYCASKFALEALADAYRFELSPFGIDSVVVEPGIYRTPIFDRLVTDRMLLFAVMHAIEVVGEAAARVSDETRRLRLTSPGTRSSACGTD
jgi:NAD(P)-dependent dehydrogenase (short-subunit alcohol dehydrogenase family)